ncbi:MAG TPA: FGGY-family carbohydrate kinase, partial [Myxococcaceae bacterium]|nr:FGGY-family carbohydrate kinase [Myxococcaceae bacterium]
GLSGERAPQRSPAARGVFFGLTLAHGRAHLIRAVLEGVMVQLAGVARLLQAAGLPLTGVRANGGAVRSEVWRRIMADAFGLPIARTDTEEASALGAALLGMVALGWKASLEEAAAGIRVAEEVHPSPGAAQSATERAREFERLTGVLDPLFEALSRG